MNKVTGEKKNTLGILKNGEQLGYSEAQNEGEKSVEDRTTKEDQDQNRDRCEYYAKKHRVLNTKKQKQNKKIP